MHNEHLDILLKNLKLTTMLEIYGLRSEEASEKGWSHEQYLRELCVEELSDRQTKKVGRLRRDSSLPKLKTLDSFDFDSTKIAPNLRRQIECCCSDASWIDRNENLLLFGPSGVGKTHLASAIGHNMVEKGIKVKFMKAIRVVQELQRAKKELALIDAMTKLDKYGLLILDDIGYVKKTDAETQVLFELISHRYESGSIIITSNHGFSKWSEIFPDEIMTVAAIDRLVHHAKIMSFEHMESFRKREQINNMEKMEMS